MTLTSQASYGRDAVSDQLLAIARLRAAETHKALADAAVTGPSAVIPPGTSQPETTALFAADQLTTTLALRTGATPYQRAGDPPIIAAAAGLWLTAALYPRRRPGRAATEPA